MKNQLGHRFELRSYETDATFDPQGKKDQWERFIHFLEHKNEQGRGRVIYKLIFVIRHGEGYHNVKEREVGRQAWDSHWSLLNGDGKTTWSDARLTEEGERQARQLNVFWRRSLRDTKMPTPEKYYTSPLARCLETTRLTYSGLDVPSDRPYRPIIKENLRERFGAHTCDRRSARSWIVSNYPEFRTESSFTEIDQQWKSTEREAESEVEGRVKQVLDDAFLSYNTVVSFTAHSGLIRALYSLTRHREVWVAAGVLVPVLIKGEIVE
ncbi:phosphoglycerate mutase-like protein [Hypoxylon trugodes]|uniref:phosphoglycerate mutase-like protein n=1 Tax=Hypoxylon trugodes TaxID=326681 RepID=UPI00219CC1F1|nr:phosphoglycerate mutase-like protein [Hypoxylon trugodes]KAI1390010.1 phosphoglycerate mutase-like protein [Hypoxylon trugodes]